MIIENTDYNVEELNVNEIPTLAGIYAYINEMDGKIYIGQTKNLRQRFLQHLHNQKANKKDFDYILQQQPSEFSYRVFIYGVEPSNQVLTSLESTFIGRYNAVSLGYNVRYDKPNTAMPTNEDKFIKLYNSIRHDFIQLNKKYLLLKNKYNDVVQQNIYLQKELKHKK